MLDTVTLLIPSYYQRIVRRVMVSFTMHHHPVARRKKTVAIFHCTNKYRGLFWCGDFGRKLDIVDVRLDIIDLLLGGRNVLDRRS